MSSILRLFTALLIFGMPTTVVATDFDPELAKKLGADDYGMRQYVLVLLKTGSANELSSDEVAELQRGHMETINRLADEGHLLLAGPFIQEEDMRGLFVFDSNDKAQVKGWVESDPAVAAGRFKAEYYAWYSAAGLKEVMSIQSKITKQRP